MSLRSLLEKELHWSTRNALILVFLLLLLPAFFAGTSLLFQDTLPRSVPVAVVAADESVNESDIEIVEGGIAPFTDPVRAENKDEATTMLERESVYAVIEVPGNMTTAGEEAGFRFIVDGSIVPFLSPSEVIQGLVETEMDQAMDADISAEREVVGGEKELPEYLFPSFLMVLVMFFAFTYVPYNIKNETAVLDRLRVESSLESVLAAKLIFFTLLVLAPVIVFHGAATYYGYEINSLAPGAVLTLLLTFVLLAIVSTTIMVLSRFSSVGLFVNVTLMLALVALSALAFPLGFFSTIRTTVAQLLPTYYAGVMTRSLMLTESSPTVFADWFGGLIVAIVLAGVALKGSIIYYRRQS